MTGAEAASARNTVLWYVYPGTPTKNEMTEAAARPILTYVRDGESRDWLFDAVMFYCGDFYQAGDTLPYEGYKSILFDESWVQRLDDYVGQYKVELKAPSYRLQVYLVLPFVNSAASTTQDRAESLITRWNNLSPSHLDLVGMSYANFESFGSVPAECSRLATYGSYLDTHGLEFTWIPGFGSPVPNLGSCGFDKVSIQPNFMRDNVYAPARFLATDDFIWQFGLAGAELELIVPSNTSITGTDDERFNQNGKGYLYAADQYNWYEHGFLPVYWNRPLGEAASGPAPRREIYDRLYRFLVARNPKSVLPTATIEADADASVQSASPGNHGSATFLSLAHNTAPNIAHAYFRFPLASIPAGAEVISAHLRLYQKTHELGEALDAKLYRVDGSWSEGQISWASQPAVSDAVTPPGVHRFHNGNMPRRHQIDVRDDVIDAIGDGDSHLSLGLRREGGAPTTAAEADAITLYSREANDSHVPALVVRYVEPGTGTGGSAGSGGTSSTGGTGGVAGAGGTGGTAGAGGASGGSGGTTYDAATGGSGGSTPTSDDATGDDGGCSCRAVRAPASRGHLALLAPLLGAIFLRRWARGAGLGARIARPPGTPN